jgi:hypothetical protein
MNCDKGMSGLKPCCPSYEMSKGSRPLEYVFKKTSQLRNAGSLKVNFDPQPPVVIPFGKDDEPALISAEKLAKIHSRKQSGPSSDSQYLPSQVLIDSMKR